MAQQLPCPNPACTHVFSADAVQSADLVKCPRCGRAFRFRAPAAAEPPRAAPVKPARPAIPMGKPAVPVARPAPLPTAHPIPPGAAAQRAPSAPLAAPVAPIARPVPPQQPVKQPVQQPAEEAESEAGTLVFSQAEDFSQPEPAPDPEPEGDLLPSGGAGPLVRSRGIVKNRWGAMHYFIIGLAVISLGSIIAFVLLYVPDKKLGISGILNEGPERVLIGKVRNLKNQDEKCFRLVVPDGDWAMENQLKTRFRALTAWKHTKEDAWFALAVLDYGQQRPRDSELSKLAIESLEAHFGDALELANKAEKSKLAGEDAFSLRFKGTANAVVWAGEVYMASYQGFGYWLYVAAPSWEEAARVKDNLEGNGKGFALTTDRRGWREQPPKLEEFQAAAAPLSISFPAGIWEKTSAKDEEETGELFLFGRFQREKDNRKNAAFLIFSSDKKADLAESAKEARAYIEKRKQEENPKYKLAPVEEGSEAGISEAVGDRSGRILEMKLQLGDDAKRYFLIAVVHHEDKAYIVRADCVWENRQIWRQDFLNALATMRFSKKS